MYIYWCLRISSSFWIFFRGGGGGGIMIWLIGHFLSFRLIHFLFFLCVCETSWNTQQTLIPSISSPILKRHGTFRRIFFFKDWIKSSGVFVLGFCWALSEGQGVRTKGCQAVRMTVFTRFKILRGVLGVFPPLSFSAVGRPPLLSPFEAEGEGYTRHNHFFPDFSQRNSQNI